MQFFRSVPGLIVLVILAWFAYQGYGIFTQVKAKLDKAIPSAASERVTPGTPTDALANLEAARKVFVRQ